MFQLKKPRFLHCNSADIVKALALGADAVYIATSALLALGCHLCRTAQTALFRFLLTFIVMGTKI